MHPEIFLAYGSSALAGVLALSAAVKAGRALDRWAFVAGMALLAIERFCEGRLAQAQSPVEMFRWQLTALTVGSAVPGVWLLFSLTYARANAREFLRKWRWVLTLLGLLPLGAVLLFRPTILSFTATSSELHLIFRLGPAGTLLYFAQVVAAVLVLVNLERTFRAAVGTVRWRIKFMLFGVALVFLVRLYTDSQALLFRGVDPALDVLNSGALLLGGAMILRSLFRAGHFNLDVHPSQSVLQGSFTILLAGTYLLVVGVFARIVSYLGGDSSFTAKTLVALVLLVLLAMLLQSDRVRLQLRRLVSRHFQRPLHDYRTVWRRFTEGTASHVEPVEFSRAVVRLLAEIFQTLSVTFWQVDERREDLTLAASTSVTDRQARELRPDAAETAAIIAHFRAHPEPVDIERLDAGWAAALRRLHPDEFHKGGTRVAVPVVSSGELLAVLLLGDRVAGTAFEEQDIDLLKSIGDQIASGLLNVRLSQRLLQAREHEAFQTMAAFFVHDLKNAASTLNLTLQNLPDHFDDPEFRKDALRGLGKSATHINHLITRLGELRHELKIAAASLDLNQVVVAGLATLPAVKDFEVSTRFEPLPHISLDRDQFMKVVTNLVLNAREAGASQLLLATRRSGSWAVFETTDNGSGMSPEFLQRSLFRPFQTTKKHGLGIGMFQSKTIIEAHGGRMTVESTAGQGTTFRIFLPLGV